LFNSERWDPGSHADGDEMHWAFPVAAGTHVAVRLYFANRCSCTAQVGQRVFDVAVDGTTVLDHYDVVQDVGDQTATMHEYDVTSPGDVTLDFTHELENPLINAVEILNLDAPTTGAAQDELAYHAISGSAIGARTVVPSSVAWGSTRGAFMVGKTVFYGTTDGTFHRAGFDGRTVGTPSTIDPYHDPAWSSVQTGSGQTYDGTSPTFYGELPQVTGAFYSAGRVYYSVAGQSALYSRWFSPDSGIVGSDEFTTAGADFSDIAGMVLSGSTLYYAKRSNGTLHSMSFANATPDAGTDTVVSGPALDGNDWRARGLFLYGPATFPNQPPVARATSSCTGSSCSFDATASSDPDGSVASYSWDFGDGTHATGATATHGYAAAGSYTVTLTVTDNGGAVSSPWSGSVTVSAPSVRVGYVAQARSNGTTANPSVVVPAGVSAGDTELLFVTTGAAGVTTAAPTGLTGWTQVGRRTNSPLETTIFQRVAGAGDSGARVTVPLTSSVATDVQFLDYSGVATGAAVLATAGDTNVASHPTPPVQVTSAGAWVVSYWADRNSSVSSWTLPGSVTPRATGVGTGGGHVDAAVADSGTPVPPGNYGGLSAGTGVVSGKAAMVSLVLVPAG
jgi:PKD repeat protein